MNPARINTYHSSIRAMSERFEQPAQSEKSDQSMRSPHPSSDREMAARDSRNAQSPPPPSRSHSGSSQSRDSRESRSEITRKDIESMQDMYFKTLTRMSRLQCKCQDLKKECQNLKKKSHDLEIQVDYLRKLQNENSAKSISLEQRTERMENIIIGYRSVSQNFKNWMIDRDRDFDQGQSRARERSRSRSRDRQIR